MQTQSSTRMTLQECAERAFGMAIGNLFLGFFGMGWLVLGLISAGRAHPAVLTALSCFLAVLFAASIHTMRRTFRLSRDESKAAERKAINRRFGLVNFLQWSLIFAAIYGLPRLGLGNWILPVVLLIIGIHFFPLARLFKARLHYLTGAVIVAWAIVYPIVFSAGKGDPIGAMGMGAILWTSAAFLCWRGLQLLRRMSDGGLDNGTVPNGAHA